MSKHWMWGEFAALGVLLALSSRSHSQDLRDVARQFLLRHGVPCQLVLKVDSSADLGEVATCQDGREWILLWLDDEIAFVQPRIREAYKWDRDVYRAHPEIFSEPKPVTKDQMLVVDFP